MKDSTQHAFYKALGVRIRHLRSPKLSQEELARSSGLSRTSIVNIEAGRQKLLVYNLFQIAAALGTTPTDLISPLIPATDAVPQVEGAGAATDWVQRSLKKANVTRPS